MECTEELLKIILKRNDLSVTKSITQLTIGNLFGRSVRLDIYANDTNGKKYDIEVQRDNSGAAPERARFNSALFDSRLTTSGEKYMEMPETYIIFITSNDVLAGGLPIYTMSCKSYKVKKPDEKVLDIPENIMDQIRLVSTYKGIHVPSMMFDSTETKKIAAIASYVIEALEQGRILVVDGLESSIHFKLTRAIVAMFNRIK